MLEEQNPSQPNTPITQNPALNSSGSILIPKISPDEINIRNKNTRLKKITLIGLAVIAVLILLFGLPLGIFAINAKSSYQRLQPIFTKESFSDVEKIKINSKLIRAEVNNISGSYQFSDIIST